MEKCKFCQSELADNGTFCPNCGRNNAEEESVTESVQEAPAAAEEAAAPVIAEEEIPAAQEKKKATPGKIALAVAAVVVLAALLIGLVVSGQNSAEESIPAETEAAEVEETAAATVPADGNPDDVTCKGSYTVTDEEALANRDIVVASIGDQVLTNGQLQVYYWSMVNSYLSSEYGYYMMYYGTLDYSQPLDTQICAEDENLTWQQYFLTEALNYWQMCQSLADNAQAEGLEMSDEDRNYLNNLTTSLEETAASYNMTLEELMLHNIGPGAGLEEFSQFQELYLSGKDYYEQELQKLTPTEEELEAFFAEHEEDYASAGLTKDARYVDARHILVQVKGGTTDENGNTTYSDAEWAECEADAQAILDQWLAGDKTEESFAALAAEKTEDPGSQATGGLYEDIYQGQMVAPFEEWCFDESRVYGDYGLVQTNYGYHVMFYVGSEPMWVGYAESDWITEKSNQFLEELTAAHPVEVSYDKITLGYIKLGA